MEFINYDGIIVLLVVGFITVWLFWDNIRSLVFPKERKVEAVYHKDRQLLLIVDSETGCVVEDFEPIVLTFALGEDERVD
jgi:hypothetical protein